MSNAKPKQAIRQRAARQSSPLAYRNSLVLLVRPTPTNFTSRCSFTVMAEKLFFLSPFFSQLLFVRLSLQNGFLQEHFALTMFTLKVHWKTKIDSILSIFLMGVDVDTTIIMVKSYILQNFFGSSEFSQNSWGFDMGMVLLWRLLEAKTPPQKPKKSLCYHLAISNSRTRPKVLISSIQYRHPQFEFLQHTFWKTIYLAKKKTKTVT